MIVNTIQDFFKFGLDREIPPLWQPPLDWASHGEPLHLNLGPGTRKILPGTVGLGHVPGPLTDIIWKAPEPLPYEDDRVTSIHCYQFLEHFNGEDVIKILRECERVLRPGGTMYIATPYYSSQLSIQALDHKSFWVEGVWGWMFGNEYYDDHYGEDGWKFRVHACFIMGIVERNINLFTQLVKE